MSDVFWLEQQGADVPAGDDWLHPLEAERQRTLRFAKRRTDWRLGRWTAKNAVAACLGTVSNDATLRAIQILAAPDGAPSVALYEQPARLTLSISHRAGFAACAVSLSEAAIGCDLEQIEPRSAAFISDFFNAGEQSWLAQVAPDLRPLAVALIWSSIESALKTLRTGLRMDTRSLSVTLAGDIEYFRAGLWAPMQVRLPDATSLEGWWCSSAGMIRTMTARPASAQPVRPSTRPVLPPLQHS